MVTMWLEYFWISRKPLTQLIMQYYLRNYVIMEYGVMPSIGSRVICPTEVNLKHIMARYLAQKISHVVFPESPS